MRARPLLLTAGILLVSLADLCLRGRGAVDVVDTNLPVPLASSGTRIVDLVRPTAPGRAIDLAFSSNEPPPSRARIEVALASAGRTRILVIRSGHPAPSVSAALRDVLSGRAALRIVPDRGWVDLGPAGDGALEVQVLGLLPGPFGLEAPLDQRAGAHGDLRLARPPGSPDPPVRLRWRLVVPRPVPTGETLARAFFFFSTSTILLAGGLFSLALLLAGALFLSRDQLGPAVCGLVAGVTLLYAVWVPPFQGADETSHAATIEALVFRPTLPKAYDPYPLSFTLVANALQQDRVQFQPGEPLPLRDANERESLRRLLESGLRDEASERGVEPPASVVQPADRRAALFFRGFRPLAPLLRLLSVSNRIASYRLLATLSGLLLFCMGALLLRRSGMSDQVLALYGVVALLPYSVAVVASCSNYAPAIGLGALLAASAVIIVLTESRAVRMRVGAVFLAGSWAGVFLWMDFVFVAGLGTLVAAAMTLARPLERAGFSATKARTLSTIVCLGVSGTAVLYLARRISTRTLDVPVPQDLVKTSAKDFGVMGAAAATPLVACLLIAVAVLALARRSEEDRRFLLRRASAAVAALLAAAFVLVPWTAVPYENTRLSFPRLVEAHLRAFFSNNFAFDQDTLSWKFTWGAFGWHDVFYPAWIYALGRWISVAVFIALPALATLFVSKNARRASRLVLVSGGALSCIVVTETLRYLAPGNPYGRFMLPFVPLAVLPVLIPIESPGRLRALRLVLAGATALQVWTAITLVGARYVFGN